MKISAILKGEPDSLGRKKIYIRISDGPARTFQATPLRINPANFKEGKVTGRTDAKKYNDIIRTLILSAEHDKVFHRQPKQEKTTFTEYAQAAIRTWAKSHKEGSIRQDLTELNKFNRFRNNVLLSDIDTDLLQEYLDHCRALGNDENTCWKTFKFIRKIVRRAHREGKKPDYPFAVFDMPKYTEPHRMYLTDAELDRMKTLLQEPASEEIKYVTAWFLIGCYTALRFSDWRQFNKDAHIVENRLILHTTKTGEIISMPLVEKVKELLELVEYKPMRYTNTHCNRLLKDIAIAAGINKEVSAHIARHTFGVRAANVMRIEAAARLMGITVRVCHTYYKIVDTISDQEYRKLFQ